ncbi:interleukin 12 receptor, beta 2a, like [Salminus brasiliensis]|uniref:interleukin 12 receptor, beta 2a, like n=1 Tax=Salminus brasiliensis TaxID=930266 RepID=UPI003B8318C5
MAWQNGALVLLLFTLNFVWICTYASLKQNVRCWWNRVTYDGENVSIECHASPPSFLQKCGRCQLHLITSKNKTQAVLHQCSRNTVNFTAALSPQAMQDVNCVLSCPGQGPENCTVKEGYPPPTCLIPDFNVEKKDIHCYWGHHPSSLYNVTLHWDEVPRSTYHGKRPWESDRGRILRTDFGDFFNIRVWVSAVSPLGSVHSDFAHFHTGSIREPLPPLITNYTLDPLEIFWDMEKEDTNLENCHCEVRYKNECDLDWTEAEGTYEGVFVLYDSEPFTKYTFLVRCGFGTYKEGITMSNWTSYTVETPATAPVGILDVWSDCEPDSDEPRCNVLWKEMPKTQARSKINSYQLRVKLNNGSELDRAGYTAAECTQCGVTADLGANAVPHPRQSHLTCLQEQDQCCFQYSQLQFPIQQVEDICVTANSPQGESSPAHVVLPRTGLPIPEVSMEVKLESQSLDVSWLAPQQFIENIQEYVVQHKRIGLPHQLCLNWIKVNKTKNSVKLKGQFCNYTPYNVSLYAVINNKSHLVQSAVVYTVQGVPSKVTDVHVTEISPSSVKLTWKPIPLEKSRGDILHYVVGIDNRTVCDVNRDENSVHVQELNPGTHYEVWICGVTVAGEGERTTTRFTTTTPNYSAIIIVVILLPCLVIVILAGVLVWCCSRPQGKFLKFFKVPDPINSKLFQPMNNQFRQSWLVPQNPSENTLTISQVEVVSGSDSLPDPEEVHELIVDSPEVEPQSEEDGDKELQEPERLERIDSLNLHKTNNYRQMIDSSEEEVSREYEDEEWEEQVSPSDYEKHFLPCIQDM